MSRGVLVLLVLVVNSAQFEFYKVTRFYSSRPLVLIYSLIFVARPIEKNWSHLQDLIPELREARRPLTPFVACSCSLLYVPCDPIINSSYISHTGHVILLIC